MASQVIAGVVRTYEACLGSTVKVTRLTDDAGACRAVVINYYLIGWRALLRHLRRQPGLTVEDSFSAVLTDDYQATLRYQGHTLSIDTALFDFTLSRGDTCPEHLFLKVVDHLAGYRPWLLNRVAAGVSERWRAWGQVTRRRGRESVLQQRQGGPPP
jgi:hypothetical protein